MAPVWPAGLRAGWGAVWGVGAAYSAPSLWAGTGMRHRDLEGSVGSPPTSRVTWLATAHLLPSPPTLRPPAHRSF